MKAMQQTFIIIAVFAVIGVAGTLIILKKFNTDKPQEMPATERPVTSKPDRSTEIILPVPDDTSGSEMEQENAPDPEPEPASLDSTMTFSEKLASAPFPYNGNYEDSTKPFFDYKDSKTRYHTNAYGMHISEDHYVDSTVTFHVPAHFNPDAPFEYVVFFHGIQTDMPASLSDYRIIEQIDATMRNVILIAPQLAKNATDTSVGKWYGHGAFAKFMQEAAAVLDIHLSQQGIDISDRLATAPIILMPFSGGYKPTAYILDRGGVDDRISGILLLDAMYQNIEMFVSWLLSHGHSTFFIGLYNDPPGVPIHEKFKKRLQQVGVQFSTSEPRTIRPGSLHIYYVDTEHLKVPLNGPPYRPVTAYLDMIE